MPRIALLQMTSGVDPVANAATLDHAVTQAAGEGAAMLFTPEMSGLLDRDRKRAAHSIAAEEETVALARVRDAASRAGIWVSLGSLAVDAGGGRWANRAFVIDPQGQIAARYDKIHMFDVEVGDGQSYRESRAYRPGERAVLAETEFGKLGMTICYDVRFPHLYRKLAQAGAGILTIPAAFTRVTGEAHWHVLVRARAIETGSFIIAPAQGGKHEDGRETFGHSLIVSPWGEVLAEKADDAPGVILADLDLDAVAIARRRIPSLGNDQSISSIGDGAD